MKGSLYLINAITITAIVQLVSCSTNVNFNTSNFLNSVEHYADVVSADNLRDPLSENSRECTPGRRSGSTYVCDASALLPERSTKRIDSEIQKLYDATSSRYTKALCNGIQMNTGYLFEVVLVRRMSTGPNGARNFAEKLFRRWKVGRSDVCGNGILLLISLEDRKYYFSVGKNVQRFMDKSRVNRVERALVRYLKSNNLYLAVLNTVIKTGDELRRATPQNEFKYGPPNSEPVPVPLGTSNYGSSSNSNSKTSPWYFILSVFGVLAIISVMFACINGSGGKDATNQKIRMRKISTKLKTIKQEYESASLPQYSPVSCSICSDNLEELDSNITSNDSTALLKEARGPPQYLRCGHGFHISCLEKNEVDLKSPVCPVCSDSTTSVGSPPTVKESRDLDLTFRVNNLGKEYPDVVSGDLRAKLLQTSSTTRTFDGIPPPADDLTLNRTSGPAWQSIAGAAGIGALTGWGITNFMRERNNSYRERDSSNSGWGFGGVGEDWTGGWSGSENMGANFIGGSGWGNSSSGWGNNTNSGWGGNWGGSGGGGGNASGFGGSW